MKRMFASPEYITGEEVKVTRKKLGLSQAEFGQLMGCTKMTVGRWEKSEEPIVGPITFAIYALMNSDALSDKVLLPEMKYGLRLNYMYRQQLCTIIDVDETHEIVEITNYRDNLMFRAFGANTAPTYAEYLDFLESRCFPRTRDKMKIVLDDLDIPFYDPMMIIEKTQGRMAEDDFWIEIERK